MSHQVLPEWTNQTADALYDNILENGLDDAPRLIFADWLDEFGDDEDHVRAEFIRIDIRLTRLPNSQNQDYVEYGRLSLDKAALLADFRVALPMWLCPLTYFDPDAPLLKKNFRRNWYTNTKDFLSQSLDKLTSQPKHFRETDALAWKIRRGFLGKWHTTATRFLRKAEQVFSSVPLTDLSLQKTLLTTQDVLHLAACPYLSLLENLDLSHTDIDGRYATILAQSPHVANLTSIDLSYTQLDRRGALALADSPHLPQDCACELILKSTPAAADADIYPLLRRRFRAWA
jgi:uncharacterized protein (TIGR02996 family)